MRNEITGKFCSRKSRRQRKFENNLSVLSLLIVMAFIEQPGVRDVDVNTGGFDEDFLVFRGPPCTRAAGVISRGSYRPTGAR